MPPQVPSISLLSTFLLSHHLHLSVAESCTGGVLSSLLTSYPGASRWMLGSITAYTSDIKERLLGVPPTLIETHGIVSSEVAQAMAQGAQKSFMSDIAISTTGFLGPTGGAPHTPIGSVWVGVALREKLYSCPLFFRGLRIPLQHMVATQAVLFAWQCILNNKTKKIIK